MILSKKMSNLSTKILFWYKSHKRDLPWRTKRYQKNPYSIWVSEIMLQQTTVNSVVNYFKKFLYKWPSIYKLSKSKIDEVLFIWQGLGYYNRAVNIHKCSRIIVKKYNGKFPSKLEVLKTLPGIGEYTAKAICAIAYDKKDIGIDVNVNRVFSRLFNINPNNKKKIKTKILKILPRRNCGNFMQAIMDIGATICKKNVTYCSICPIKTNCIYQKKKNKKNFFDIKKRNKKKFIYFYFIKNGNNIFLKKRTKTKFLNGLMEMPSSQYLNHQFSFYQAKKFAPVDLNWEKVPGGFNYNISNFNLEIKFLKAEINTRINISPGKWVNENKLKLLPLSTLTKKALNFLI